METSESKNNVLAGVLAVVAVLSFSTKAVFVKLALRYTDDYLALLLLRMLFSLPVYLLIGIWYVAKNKKKISISWKTVFSLVFLGFIGYYLSSFLDFAGLSKISASLERLILFIYPTFVLFINRLYNKTPITRGQTVATVVSYIGLFFIFKEGISGMTIDDTMLMGGGLVLMSALSYATFLVGSQTIMKKMDSSFFTSSVQVVSCVCVIIHFVIAGSTSISTLPMEVYGYGILMAVVSTLIPSYLLAFAIKRMGASNVSVLGALGPISTILLAFIFLGEFMTELQWYGGGIIMIGVMSLIFIKNRKTSSV